MPVVSKSKLEIKMRDAQSYAEWVSAAKKHDRLTEKDKWRKKEKTPLYDYRAIRRRLIELKRLRAAGDHRGLLYTLNQGIHGNIGGMGSAKLYRQSKFGTKDLVTDYIDEVVDALDHLKTTRTRKISFEERLEFFHRADHCYGQSALMLSGGGMLAHFHIGVAKALSDESVLPSVISGSSGGSVVAAVLGTHTDDELHQFFDVANLAIETKREAGWFAGLFSISSPKFEVDDIVSMVERLIPDQTFAEAYETTGRNINISIAPYEQHQSSRLMNAITSPNVFVRSAVLASCAIPGIYPPVKLEAKSPTSGKRLPYLPSRRWIDGSMGDDLPAKRLSRLYGVNHYIASQVNPLVSWMLVDPKASQGLWSTGYSAFIRSYQEFLRATQPLTHKVVRSLPRLEYLYRNFYSIATQQYTGDITITPRSRVYNPMKLLSPMTERELMGLVSEGQQATFPRIEMIRNCTKISRKLQQVVHEFDRRALRTSHRLPASKVKNKAIPRKPAA